MGNNKFKFSDMMPNAWFYKLKDMSKTKTRSNNKQTAKKKLTPTTTQQQKPKLSHPNKKTQKIITTTRTESTAATRSADKFPPPKNYVSKHSELIRFPEAPPRKSTKSRSSTSRRKVPVLKPNYSQSFLSSSGSSSSDENVPSEFDSELDFVNESSWPSSCNYNCRLSSSTADIIIDLNDDKNPSSDHVQLKTTTKTADDNGSVGVVTGMIDLPPILTKPINFDDTVFEATKHRTSSRSTRILSSDDQEKIMNVRRDHKTTNTDSNHARKSFSSSSGIRLRTHSPRLASKKIQAYARKTVSSRNRHLSESFAVVKSSVDPQRDFRDSMVEMIVENNIRASKDLEELLACYLSLNSKEYHDVIVKAFEQIWFDMADLL